VPLYSLFNPYININIDIRCIPSSFILFIHPHSIHDLEDIYIYCFIPSYHLQLPPRT